LLRNFFLGLLKFAALGQNILLLLFISVLQKIVANYLTFCSNGVLWFAKFCRIQPEAFRKNLVQLYHWYRFLKTNIGFNSKLGAQLNYFVNKIRPKHRAPMSNNNMHRTLLHLVVPNIAAQFNSAQPSVKVPVMFPVR